jgi:hypothetical protein
VKWMKRDSLSIPGLSGVAEIELEITGPDNIQLANKAFKAGRPLQPLSATSVKKGFHSLSLKTSNSSPGSSFNYKLSVT